MNAGIEETLVHYLGTLTALTDLVGSRIFPVKKPQGEQHPCVTYQLISGERLQDIDGPAGYAQPRVQIDCWGLSYAAVKAAARAIIGEQDANNVSTALDGYTGWMGPANSRLWIQAATVGTVQDFYDAPQNASDAGVFRVSFDVTLSFNENGS